jgi:hypothetical protein
VEIERLPGRANRVLLWKSSGIAGPMVVLFFAGSQAPKAALIGIAVLLGPRRVKSARVYHQIDWLWRAGLNRTGWLSTLTAVLWWSDPAGRQISDFGSMLG